MRLLAPDRARREIRPACHGDFLERLWRRNERLINGCHHPDDSVNFMIDIATESGVLPQPMNAAEIVDRETLSRAVELANMPTG